MKRSRVWVGLVALAVVVALFLVAKPVAKARPVRVEALDVSVQNYAEVDLRVSPRYVVAGADSAYTRFDLQSGARLPLKNANFLAGDEWLGFLEISDSLVLRLRKAGESNAIYRAPTLKTGKPNIVSVVNRPDVVRVTPHDNRVEMLQNGVYYRWNLRSRALERLVGIKGNLGHAQAIARDGETVICAATDAIYRSATRSPGAPLRVAFRGVEVYKERQLSPFGSYAIYEDLEKTTGKNAPVLRVIDTANGRELWNVDWKLEAFASRDNAIFSPDETLVAIPFSQQKRWEIRKTQTGAIVHTLPLLPGLQAAAFAPDNSMLYSVVSGTLYRQRTH